LPAGVYALHCLVSDAHGSSGEFYVRGRGERIDTPHLRAVAAQAASYTPQDRYVLFELRVAEARCNGYGDVAPPRATVVAARPRPAGMRSMHAETFRVTVVPAGNATGAEVPAEVLDALGEGKRPAVAITINGHTWRSRVASKQGRYLVGLSAANRAAPGIAEGDQIEVTLRLDTEPRELDEPADLKVALDAAPTAPRHLRPAPLRAPTQRRQLH
jgi:Domain of unknown function (DUF1905)